MAQPPQVQVHSGRLKYFLQQWQSITNDAFILKTVTGYIIPFSEVPHQNPMDCPRRSFGSNDLSEVKNEINHLLDIKAIRRCKETSGQFVSDIFLIPKSDGSKRFILNLKKLNKYIYTEHFKMEDVRTATKLMCKDCYMINIDIKEAYFLLPIHKSHTKFLRFYFEGNLYEFLALPFGLCSAPYIFTKILQPVFAHLRSNGLLSVRFLDDFLCLGKTAEDCLKNANITIQLLTSLGFVINFEKSNLTPQTTCKFLGFLLNSNKMIIELPASKRQKILQLIITLTESTRIRIRDFARILGSLTAACPAIVYGWAHTKSLERAKYIALLKNHDNYDAFMTVTDNLRDDLHWWKNNILIAVNSIRNQNYDIEIYTDASTTGWGAACDKEKTGGLWTTTESTNHINYLELLAAYFGLKSFAGQYRNCNILLRVDNTTAISYINRMGGVQYPHLNQISRKIWDWCEERRIFVFASYIPSSLNTEADGESRKINVDTEWELSSQAFAKIVLLFGEPCIDLFASRINTKCPLYVSWKKDPFAYNIDAFTVDWSQYYFYAFPPFALILKTLNKIVSDKATGIVVVPLWPSQPWYPFYMSLCIKTIEVFSPSKNLLSSPFRSTHPLSRHLSLVACVLSGKGSVNKTFQKKL